MAELEGSDAKEIKELEEHAEHPHNRRIGVLISVIAILLAVCGSMTRKAENSAIMSVVRSSDGWAYFQAKKLRENQSEATSDVARLLSLENGPRPLEAARALASTYQSKGQRYQKEAEAISKKAEGYTKDAEMWEARAERLSSGEIFLQVAVVLCSIAILTQGFAFVYGGLGSAIIGIGMALSSFLIR